MPGDVDDQKRWLAGVFDRAAPTYDRVGDSYHDHFGRRLVEFAHIAPGATVLDVACGRGAVLVPAAERVGDTGRVVGVDLSPEMVESARAALARTGLHAPDLRVMDAEHLELSDAAFDVALCSFGVFFFPDPEQAASELYRVLVPGGTVGLSSWTGDDERWAWEQELLGGLDVARRAVARPFSESAELEQLLGGAGFEAARVHLEHRDIRFASEDEWWEWMWSFSIRGVLEQLDDSAREAYRAAAYEAMQALKEPDGFPMRLSAFLTFARKPD
jgi:ubiquinone/menaquinone biosynthesis C-methylase UbiE